jgi:hypothetical protein
MLEDVTIGVCDEEMPDLEIDDLKATLLYAARKLDHPVLIA